MEFDIRWITRRDMISVQNIEEESFEFPWSEDDFNKCMRQHTYSGMVATLDDHVVGYMIYELHPQRLNLLNFAVDTAVRRSGVGTAMAERLISKLAINNRNRITLTINETNLPAQLFFKRLGFKAVKILPKFFKCLGRDAYVMEFRIAVGTELLRKMT